MSELLSFPFGHKSNGNFSRIVRGEAGETVVLDLDRAPLTDAGTVTLYFVRTTPDDERELVERNYGVGDTHEVFGVTATLESFGVDGRGWNVANFIVAMTD